MTLAQRKNKAARNLIEAHRSDIAQVDAAALAAIRAGRAKATVELTEETIAIFSREIQRRLAKTRIYNKSINAFTQEVVFTHELSLIHI